MQEYWETFKDYWARAAVWVAANPRASMIIAIIWNAIVVLITLGICGR
jgi:hypothetical protein